jgi:hypothetical protein
MIATGRMGRLSCREVAAGAQPPGSLVHRVQDVPVAHEALYEARRWPSAAHRKVRHWELADSTSNMGGSGMVAS